MVENFTELSLRWSTKHEQGLHLHSSLFTYQQERRSTWPTTCAAMQMLNLTLVTIYVKLLVLLSFPSLLFLKLLLCYSNYYAVCSVCVEQLVNTKKSRRKDKVVLTREWRSMCLNKTNYYLESIMGRVSAVIEKKKPTSSSVCICKLLLPAV